MKVLLPWAIAGRAGGYRVLTVVRALVAVGLVFAGTVCSAEPVKEFAPAQATASANSQQGVAPAALRLAVIGVSNQTGEKEFNQLLIAQGIAHLVAQALFDTGRYVPVEDNPEITGRIDELVALAAAAGSEPLDYDRIDRRSLGCDAIASVTIRRFAKSRLRGFLGPFSAANVEIEIEVAVAVREGDTPALEASGTGKGATKSLGVLFQVREDQVHFDQTTVGQATQTAVLEAVSRLAGQKRGGG